MNQKIKFLFFHDFSNCFLNDSSLKFSHQFDTCHNVKHEEENQKKGNLEIEMIEIES